MIQIPPTRARQIEIALKIQRILQNGIELDMHALESELRPKMRILEQAIRAFEEKYIWDLSYPLLRDPFVERKVCDDVCFRNWNPHGPTPEPTRQQLIKHFDNQRQLYRYHQKLKNICQEYNDAVRELRYWNHRLGPLKASPRLKP